jgi:hypothetical protein
MNLSRRLFLFGSASAVAAAAISANTYAAIQPIILPTSKRIISGFNLVGCGSPNTADSVMTVELAVDGDQRFRIALNSRASYLWRAVDNENAILLDNKTLRLSATGDLSSIELWCEDRITDTWKCRLVERYTFREDETVQVETLALNVKDTQRLNQYRQPITTVNYTRSKSGLLA